MNHSTTNHATAYRRPAWIATALALGIMAGSLLVFSSNQEASAAPDGPEKVFALTSEDRLLRFDGDNPEDVNRKRITGLAPGDSLVGIDFRPTNSTTATPGTQGDLYGISKNEAGMGYVYTINPKTAVATRGPALTAGTPATPVVLRGNTFGIDFNPTVDRLRIVSGANQNLRTNVDTGATLVDGDLAYAAGDPNAGTDPMVGSGAYRNSQPGAFGGTTELYDIDAATDDMSEQDPPNDGTLVTEGPLNVKIRNLQGFDIVTTGPSPAGDRGFAALKPMATPSDAGFYRVNLNNGAAAKIGRIGNGDAEIEGLAIPIGQN